MRSFFSLRQKNPPRSVLGKQREDDGPHLVLQESFWHEDTNAATRRYIVTEADTGDITTCAGSYQAYNEDEYRELLESCGFHSIELLPSLTGRP